MRPYYAVTIAKQTVRMRSLTIHLYEAYIQFYPGEHLNESPIHLVSDFSTEVTYNRYLRTCNFPLEDPIYFLQTPKDAEILSKSFAQLGYTVCFVRDSCLIPVDRRIPIGCNAFLQASRAFSRNASAIKQLIKIFSLT